MIGIIGNGVVGSRYAAAFEATGERVLRNDLDPFRNFASLADIDRQCVGAFVCVPTPTENGRQDTAALWRVFGDLHYISDRGDCVYVVKSTVLPGTMEKICDAFPSIPIVHSPEFLNEDGGISEIINRVHVFGMPGNGRGTLRPRIEDIIRPLGEPCFVSLADSQMLKYMANCFYATKNAYFNHMRVICEHTGADFEEVRSLFASLGYVHPIHTYSPGKDGRRGYGGMCLPKDIAALDQWCVENGLDASLFHAVRGINAAVRTRPQEDPVDYSSEL